MNSKLEDTYILSYSKKLKAIEILGGKCCLCGCNNFVVLDFHHNNDKEYTINKIRNGRWSLIEREIKKCSLLCANCHSEMHYKSGRNGEKVTDFLFNRAMTKCSMCGYFGKNVASLDFHHVDTGKKIFGINQALLRKVDVSLEELEEELLKCQLLCRNCHRKVHFDDTKFNKFKTDIEKKMLSYKEKRPKIDRTEVFNMIDRGMKQKEIALYFGCAKSTISMIVKQ